MTGIVRGIRRIRRVAGRLLSGAEPPRDIQPRWREQLVAVAYRRVLGREPNAQEVLAWSAGLQASLTPGAFLEHVASSAEAARARTAGHDPERSSRQRLIVALTYRLFLHRRPEPEDDAHWRAKMDNGLSLEGFTEAIANSEEALHKLRMAELGDGLSDGAFLLRSSGILFGRGLLPSEVATLQRRLEREPGGRLHLATERINAQLCVTPAPPAPGCIILGTNRMLGRAAWDERRRERLPDWRHNATAPTANSIFNHSGAIKVSMIASLYRGGRFIERFLQNITSQTMFHASELIIIDANSPDGEREIIERYQNAFDNIVYKRIDFQIGIYEAWNLGVALARGVYLTNTNMDDLRRNDSIALQAAYLDDNPGVDVAYQEFFYSLDADLSFEEVAVLDFRSELPIVTRHNLLGCNSPHNAPMWRKSLHDAVGLFDPKYKSGGDHEFWLRCLAAGHRFGKINTPHVVYFQNPEGMSTRPDTPGIPESHETIGKYAARLISPALIDTRQGFMARLGFGEVAQAGDARAYYDVAQDALLHLASGRVAVPVNQDGEGRRLRILLDGLCFQRATTACGPILAALAAREGLADEFDLFVLDRGGCPVVEGLQRIEFPSYHGTYTAADSLLIQERCDALGIDVFMSAERTTALSTPQVQFIYEGWGMAGLSRTEREEKEIRLAAAYSSLFACVSESARAQLLLRCPNVEPARVLLLHGKQAMAGDENEGARLWLGLCKAWRQIAVDDFNALADPFYRDWTLARGWQAEVDVGAG